MSECVTGIEVVSSPENDTVVMYVTWDSGRVEALKLDSLDDVNDVLQTLGFEATLFDGTSAENRTIH